MSIGTLEETAETNVAKTQIRLCELKPVAIDSLGHEDKKLLLPRWEPCIKCSGYILSCPGYR